MSNAASPADALPANWVDQIFRKLSIRYGRQFMARWDGIDEADVKADWAEVLGGFIRRPDCIAYALEHLPVDKPPTAAQFRELCNAMPAERETFKALPSPRDPAPASLAGVAKAVTSRAAASDGKAWARSLKARDEAGDKRITRTMREMYRSALRLDIATEAA